MLRELPNRLAAFPELLFQGVKWYWEKPAFTSDCYPNPETQAMLERAYKKLQREYGLSLFDLCEECSKEVQDLERGFRMVVGRFETDIDRFFKMPGQTHWWCVDLNYTIVDLTASQFNSMMWGRNRISEGVYVLTRAHPLYQRFIPGDM